MLKLLQTGASQQNNAAKALIYAVHQSWSLTKSFALRVVLLKCGPTWSIRAVSGLQLFIETGMGEKIFEDMDVR